MSDKKPDELDHRSRENQKRNPHVPISSARDQKHKFSHEQRKFLKKFQRAARKLEMSISAEFEEIRLREEIMIDITRLSEKLTRTRREKKILERIEDLKILHKKLRKRKLEIKKKQQAALVQNDKIEKLKQSILHFDYNAFGS